MRESDKQHSRGIVFAISLNLVNGFTGQFSIGHAGFMAVGAYVSGYLSTEVIKAPGIFDFLWFAVAGGLVAVAGPAGASNRRGQSANCPCLP